MRARLTPAAIATFVAAAAILLPAASATAALPCGTGSNPVVCENSKPGTPFDDWYSASAWGDIAGFTTKASVAPGETLQLKVQSPSSYQIHIYRLGWYGGDGARLMPTSPTQTFPAKTGTGLTSGPWLTTGESSSYAGVRPYWNR